MRYGRSSLLGLAAFALLGCHAPAPLPDGAPPPLVGRIESLLTRQLAALPSEVANGATVSLIDPSTGNTLATTLSTPTGQFKMDFGGTGFTAGATPYFLEAAKGLGKSGVSNQAGSSIVRLRTLIRLQNGDWESLSSGGLYLGRSTTALCILSSLKGLSNTQNQALLKTLTIGAPLALDGITSTDTFAGTAAVSALEYQRVWDLVYRALEQNNDPIETFVLRPNATASLATDLAAGYGLRDGFGWVTSGLAVSDVSPAAATVGSTLTLYGHGLDAGLTVKLNSLACTVLTTDGSTATFRLPTGATSGTLEVRSGPWTHRGLFVTVL